MAQTTTPATETAFPALNGILLDVKNPADWKNLPREEMPLYAHAAETAAFNLQGNRIMFVADCYQQGEDEKLFCTGYAVVIGKVSIDKSFPGEVAIEPEIAETDISKARLLELIEQF